MPGFEMQLPRAARPSSDARRQLRRWLGAELEEAGLDTAKLLTSELVNNAVLHGEGTITLRAALDGDRLLLK